MEKHLSSGALLSDDALKVSVERPARTSLMEAMGTMKVGGGGGGEKGSEGVCEGEGVEESVWKEGGSSLESSGVCRSSYCFFLQIFGWPSRQDKFNAKW